jgi:protein TonB
MDSATRPTAPLPVPSPTGCPFAVHLAPPAYGTNPTVDWEPYPITKVAPGYPDTAREANVDGTVLVVALVCEHGYVVDVRVATSIPMLDAAAVGAVRQWVFRPARIGLKAVPFWTDVPIRFSLH